ncbi:MAG: ECF transporter S component, partial [Lachnospiraceae bacterium]|nr:ECF transporter S component [Lachnospiraceae bacterium]
MTKTNTSIAVARPILRESNRVLWITITALFMGINIVFATMGIPVPGGAIYLCDVIICTAAMLLDPLGAFAVGGIGSFLGDMFFYP